MTKPLREAESNGVRYVYDPDAQNWRWGVRLDSHETMPFMTAAEWDVLPIELQVQLRALRAQPWEPKPPSDVVLAIRAVVAQVEEGIGTYEEATLALEERIRPLVLASTPTPEIVDELVKRGGRKLVRIRELQMGNLRDVLILPPEPTR